MKYRILLLAALMFAILAAAAGGTLAGYTMETSYSISIQPMPAATAKPHKPEKSMTDIQTAEDAVQEGDTQAEPEASPEAPDGAVKTSTADDAPPQTSDKEALPQNILQEEVS